MQLEMLLRMCESIMRYQRRYMGQLGGFRFEKLLTRRRIEEKIANGYGSPQRQSGLFDADYFAAVNLKDGSGGFILCAGFKMKASHRCDGRQRFAAKSQRRDRKEVVGIFNFRGGMAFEGQHRVITHHAAAIIGNLNQLLTAAF